MLFNSFTFIFGFLPLTALGFFLLGRASRTTALRWLILASLVFYAWWRPLNVLLIAPSILINFGLSRLLQRQLAGDNPARAKVTLILGILFNIGFLGYFKYANFFVGATNDVFGTHYVLTQIILPLGISFITFQKIAFLVDVYSRRIETFTLQDYSLFVLFFPQLIAGPIVHYREMMPQFHRATCRYDASDVTVGCTLFAFGLFKKAVLADSIAPSITQLYAEATQGTPLSLFLAWMAAIGFTFQIYFDFSGYTDMALGIARIFGIRLPPNFNSPLRAASIIDFWLRWHLSLTRFLTAYIYNPLSLNLTRRRIARGLPAVGGRNTTAGAFLTLLAFPTMVTMVISGFWHGAGYLFIIWGALHGLFLTVNHAWRLFARRAWSDKVAYARVMRPIGLVLTFLAVATAMVFFRATTISGAMSILRGMVGLNGVALPETLHTHLGAVGAWLQAHGVGVTPVDYFPFSEIALWLVGLGAVAFLLPNTQQLMERYEPALGFRIGQGEEARLLGRMRWRPNLAWAILLATALAWGVLKLSGPSEFLYWQF